MLLISSFLIPTAIAHSKRSSVRQHSMRTAVTASKAADGVLSASSSIEDLLAHVKTLSPVNQRAISAVVRMCLAIIDGLQNVKLLSTCPSSWDSKTAAISTFEAYNLLVFTVQDELAQKFASVDERHQILRGNFRWCPKATELCQLSSFFLWRTTILATHHLILLSSLFIFSGRCSSSRCSCSAISLALWYQEIRRNYR